MFPFIVGFILIVVVILLSLPFLRKSGSVTLLGQEAEEGQERLDLEIERQTLMNSLAELDLDRAQEKFSQNDYERLKAVDERRFVSILGRIDELDKKQKISSFRSRKTQPHKMSERVRWSTSVFVSFLLIGSTTGIYYYIMDLQDQKVNRERSSQSAQGMPNPAEMVARLETRLKENPDDLDGQMMAGRSYMTLGRYEDAKKAWSKVLELEPRNHFAHLNLGIILLETKPRSNTQSLEQAVKHFNKALVNIPREPVLLWYHGVALVRLNRMQQADESWTTAYQNLMPGTEESNFVKDSLQKLRAGNPPLF